MHLLAASAAAALLLVGGFALVLRKNAPSESLQVAAGDRSLAVLSDKQEDVYDLASLPTNNETLTGERVEREGLHLKSLEQCVAEAEIIVAATALDFAPAPPNVLGDAPEDFIRFRVKRVLKGRLAAEEIKTRTPTAPGEFIGHDWIVMLSPEYLAGKHSYASCLTIKFEPAVTAVLSNKQSIAVQLPRVEPKTAGDTAQSASRTFAAFSPIANVDGWSVEHLAKAGITIRKWKHTLQGETPALDWLQIVFDCAQVPRDQDVLMTAWLGNDAKEGPAAAVRAVRDNNHPDKVSILFTVRNDHAAQASVDIFIWQPELEGDWKAHGYRLSIKRVLELAMAEADVKPATPPDK